MMVSIGNGQLQGKRENQQDYFAWFTIDDMTIALLADGMGGYKGGREASVEVLNAFKQHLHSCSCIFEDIHKDLRASLNNANNYLAELKELNPDLMEMGTTFLAVVIKDYRYKWLSVGDSPLYLINKKKITRLNELHHYGQILEQAVLDGELSPEEARSDPDYGALNSAVTGKKIPYSDCPEKARTLQAGDALILASDGIHTLSDNEIEIIINTQQKENTSVEPLLKAVEKKNNQTQDNVTIVTLNID